MKKQTETLRKTRTFLLDLISDLNNEQLNRIPEGFPNNIVWHLGHVIAAQQGICYKRIGLPIAVGESFFETFKPGSRPERDIEDSEVEDIKVLALSTIDRFENDVTKGIFDNYMPWTTRYGVELKTIEDAMQFIHYHEGLHTGYIMTLKRAIRQL